MPCRHRALVACSERIEGNPVRRSFLLALAALTLAACGGTAATTTTSAPLAEAAPDLAGVTLDVHETPG